MTEEQRVESRRAFYAKVSEELMERMKSHTLTPDEPDHRADDYDGGRYDYYTTRGISK